ncbi:MAG: VIT1/CCC1 transporter family protein [Ignavibacteria bacterium]|nr:VIT1/CCC1 transporter family protein [Ignavibacteria bacterium]
MTSKSDFWKVRLNEWTSLEIPERMSEILFGLIMVLTFAGTISVSSAGEQEVGQLLWAALGCNVAWGLVDGIMYLMDVLIGRAYKVKILHLVKQSQNKTETRKILRENMAPLASELMNEEEIDVFSERIKKLPDISVRKVLTVKNFLVAGQIFLLVFFVTFPVALPFVFIHNVALALRVSNGIAVLLLFAAGFILAKYSGLKPVKTALVYTSIGVFLVALTMALGG